MMCPWSSIGVGGNYAGRVPDCQCAVGAPAPSLVVRRTSASGTAVTEVSIRVQTSMYARSDDCIAPVADPGQGLLLGLGREVLRHLLYVLDAGRNNVLLRLGTYGATSRRPATSYRGAHAPPLQIHLTPRSTGKCRAGS
jgi:hypothetical protein